MRRVGWWVMRSARVMAAAEASQGSFGRVPSPWSCCWRATISLLCLRLPVANRRQVSNSARSFLAGHAVDHVIMKSQLSLKLTSASAIVGLRKPVTWFASHCIDPGKSPRRRPSSEATIRHSFVGRSKACVDSTSASAPSATSDTVLVAHPLGRSFPYSDMFEFSEPFILVSLLSVSRTQYP
jgi:hypothetical protein